ncbi:MAG: GNAT family N-acetyltransferase [Planctomycetota bacterium]
MKIVSYRKGLRGDLVEAWNRIFATRRNFVPMTRTSWRDRIEAASGQASFESRLFRLAVDGATVIGFVHGGFWENEFLATLAPEQGSVAAQTTCLGMLTMIAVVPERRRTGIGTALLESLRAEMGKLRDPAIVLRADGRVYNPYYGNFFAPAPPPWGTTEGVSVLASDVATRGFFSARGFHEAHTALSLVMDPRRLMSETPPIDDVERPLSCEIVEEDDYQPILGSATGIAFSHENLSHTWVAVHGDVQVGTIIAYPLAAAGKPATRWAIYSLEVEPQYRGCGIARQLLWSALRHLRALAIEEVETLVIPQQSPAALRLYRSAGFREAEAWIVYK